MTALRLNRDEDWQERYEINTTNQPQRILSSGTEPTKHKHFKKQYPVALARKLEPSDNVA